MLQTPIQRSLLIFIVALTVGATGYMTLDVIMRSARAEHTPAPEPRWPAPAFTMLNQDHQTVTEQDLQGKVWVVGFFFTSCPMICPQMNAQLAAFGEQLDRFGVPTADVRLVSLSIDPQTDRPDRLKEYAALFQADPDRWMFLTHPEGDREAVWRLVGVDGFKMTVTATPDDPGGNPIEHSPRFLLIDRQGMVRDSYDSREAQAMQRLWNDTRAVAEEVVGAER